MTAKQQKLFRLVVIFIVIFMISHNKMMLL